MRASAWNTSGPEGHGDQSSYLGQWPLNAALQSSGLGGLLSQLHRMCPRGMDPALAEFRTEGAERVDELEV